MNIDGLREVECADIWKGERRAGTIVRTDLGNVFSYDGAYVLGEGEPVATALPVDADPVLTPGGALAPFFANLLPEGRRFAALCRAVKTSADDDLTMLLAVGGDLAGDVRVVPSGSEPEAVVPMVVGDDAALDFRMLAESAGLVDRSGIAGVQDKVSAVMMTLPARLRRRAAILKFNPPEYPNLVENEAYFLALAKRAKFDVPPFSLVRDANGEAGLLVQRFDRDSRDAHAVHRLSMEDAAQALNIYPADKYRVSSEESALALIRHCASRQVAALHLFRQFAFAWLIGNGDLHAKNIAMIRRSGEWAVSPIFDTPSSLPFDDTEMALDLAGRNSDLSRKAFRQFADAVGLPQVAADRAMDELLRATVGLADEWAAAEQPFMRSRNREVVQHLRHRRRLMEGSA